MVFRLLLASARKETTKIKYKKMGINFIGCNKICNFASAF